MRVLRRRYAPSTLDYLYSQKFISRTSFFRRLRAFLFFCGAIILSLPAQLPAVELPAAEEPSSLELMWRFPVGGKISAVRNDPERDRIYAVAEDRYLHAFTIEGAELWKNYIDTGKVEVLRVGCDGTVYLVAEGEKVVAINKAGGLIWLRKPFNERVSELLLLSNGGLVCIGAEGAMAAYTHSGTMLWKSSIEIKNGGVVGAAAIFDGSEGTYTAYAVSTVGTGGGMVAAFSINGVQMWQKKLEKKPRGVFPVSDGVGVRTEDELHSYTYEGRERRRLQIGRNVAFAVGPNGETAANSFFVLRTPEGFLEKYDFNGERKWRAAAGGGSCTLVSNSRSVLLLDDEGWCELYSAEGERILSRRLSPPASDPILGPSGLFVYGRKDWLVETYRLSEESPASAAGRNEAAKEAVEEQEPGGAKGSRKGESSSRLSSCVPIREEGIDTFPVLKEELGSGERARKRRILETIEKHFRSKEPREHENAFVSVVEYLAEEGVLRSEYRRGVIQNDFPEIRREAVRLLGLYGDHRSARLIHSILSSEWDSSVSRACIVALGKLGGVEDGRGLERMAMMINRNEYNGISPNLFATSLITAVERISRYRGVVSGEVGEILGSIYLGPFQGKVRKKAITTMRDLKGSAYLHFRDYTEREKTGEDR